MIRQEIQISETKFIKRSQIKFAPYNPKNHSKEDVATIRKNFKKVGFLGGIIWNENTGNLVDGHKRVMALDSINKYKGEPEKDYEIKVEVCNLDEKTEMEQNVFQIKSRTELDYTLLSDFVNIIDVDSAGLTPYDINLIGLESGVFVENNGSIDNDIQAMNNLNNEQKETKKSSEDYFDDDDTEESEDEKKAKIEKIKEIKNTQKRGIEGNPYFTVTFPDFEAKCLFLEQIGVDVHSDFVQGSRLEEYLNFE